MKQAIDKLNELLMLDHDAVKAYSSAIEHIDIPYVKERLAEFRGDHERHITNLRELIVRLGGEPKDHVDFKGPFIDALTKARSMMGNEQAIKAMKSNEELTNKKYSEALSVGLSSEATEVVRKNYEDEQRHLAFIEQVIQQRIWESAGGGAHP